MSVRMKADFGIGLQFCFFLDLVELQNQSAEGATNALLHSQFKSQFTRIHRTVSTVKLDRLNASVIMGATSGAATGATSGVATRLFEWHKNAFVRHCPQ